MGLFLKHIAIVVSIVLISGTAAVVFAATLPDSTVVKVSGNLTTTLGKLRASHKTREQARVDAKSKGAAAGKALKGKQLRILRLSQKNAQTPSKTTGTTKGKTAEHLKISPVVGHAGGVYGPFSTPTPFPLHLVVGGFINSGLLGNLATNVVEPSSSYASTPYDMRAFCAAAAASACAYLPPQQQVVVRNGAIDNVDAIITSTQCSQEGGVWNGSGGGVQSVAACDFFYQQGVTVHFNPGSGLQIAQSAVCNPPWTYTVDVHGAVYIQLVSSTPQNQFWTTPNNATCIVRVSVGG